MLAREAGAVVKVTLPMHRSQMVLVIRTVRLVRGGHVVTVSIWVSVAFSVTVAVAVAMETITDAARLSEVALASD